MSSFKYWTRDKLKERFGLKRVYDDVSLLTWLDTETQISDFEKQVLLQWQKKMLKYIDYWNEEEVKLKFIGTIIALVDYDTENLSSFADRNLEGTVEGEFMQGNPDFMVARGKQDAKSPFFFVHEYKKEAPYPPKGEMIEDPAGQLLAAMLVAYDQNLQVAELKEKPVYGAYVIGRNWFFVTLQNRNYCISNAFVSTHEDELLAIFRILKANRNQIREIWGE